MSTSCKICEKFDKKIKVDYLEGEKFPIEFQDFIAVTGTDNEVSRCPLCGQAYVYTHNWDNDVYNLMDYGTLHQIAENRVLEIIAYYIKQEKDRIKDVKKFWYKARKKFGIQLEQLSNDEKKVIEYLKEKTFNGEYLENIARDLLLSKDEMIEIAKNLDKSGIVFKNIYWPLGPGEHNFQEEFKGGDPYVYTKIRILV